MEKVNKLGTIVFLTRAGCVLALAGVPVAMAMLWGVWAGIAGLLLLLPILGVIFFWATVYGAVIARTLDDERREVLLA